MRKDLCWKIGDVQIDNPFVLAPMAGVTDPPFRQLCKEQGAGLICMEMVSAKAISYHNRNTKQLLIVNEKEHPVSLQLFGREPALMAEVARQIEEIPFDILDINMGCPVPKVVNNGEGSALLKEPQRIGEIVSAVSSAIRKPLTVKIRIGFEDAPVDIVDIARRIEGNGAAALAVHGRTRQQYYSGSADWETIARIREAVKIPVIANGDVDSPEKAARCMELTGCKAVMIGRAARGNPWIFSELLKAFNGEGTMAAGPFKSRQDPETIRQMILRHSAMQIEFIGEKAGMREMRKHIAWYSAGIPHGAALRRKANMVSSYGELKELLSDFAG